MDRLVLLFLVLLLGSEAALWIRNPMHIPEHFLPARALGLQLFQEVGPAMEPAVASGRYVLVSSWSYWGKEPQAGDIVAFSYPDDPSVADVKRIVATGGSTIEVKQGQVYVDGKPIVEPYAHVSNQYASRELPERRIPPHSFFVMGDNRDQSEDSRNYGPIQRDRIIGKRWF